MRNDVTIRPIAENELETVETLVRGAFAEEGEDVLALMGEIRASENHIPDLDFVAEVTGEIVGYFMLSKFAITGAEQVKNMMLAPVAVRKDLERQGIGQTILEIGLLAAKVKGYASVTVEGNPAFYHKLGFKQSNGFGIEATSGFPLTHPECLMAKELLAGALAGVEGKVIYPYFHA